MTTRARPARTILLGTAALFLGLLAAPVIAEDKPKDHADGPAAAYEPSMTTLGQIKVEIPGLQGRTTR
jgi:nitrite reductase (NO-forming)/hydroxylamine reductase